MRLFDFELRWARAACDALFPEDTPLPHGLARMKPEEALGAIIASAPFEPALGLRIAVWLLALAPFWLLKRPRTIVGATSEERQRVYAGVLASPVYFVRQLGVAFKATVALLYAQSADVRLAMLEAGVQPGHAPGHGRDVPPPLESGFVLVRTSKQGRGTTRAA
jgi:hypothetical protein